ncbi:hypothetical protein Q9S36_07290 [Microbacterium sp. ARD31]|uniref:hypothetical protein n=1 Tax=Microbacterium sp. ARD31 TaxID=2962576 RepID=UPI002881B7C7|nr:hypothetical protein [Microbacterium sp. ARD31]MDT0180013.1 hypothetical protein [Microbacterium sp. ARD31]
MPLRALTSTIQPCPLPLLRSRDVAHPERGVAAGVLVRVRAGVYASTPLWNALPPWHRYLARVHAVALVTPDAVFCLESAAALQGMPIFGDPRTVHVAVTDSSASRLVSGVNTHRTTLDRDVVEVGGIAMTSAADTAVDLGRHRHPAVGLAAADAALRLEADLSREALQGVNEGRRSSRGRNLARWPLSRATADAETALESVSRAVIEWLGFPPPDLQVSFVSTDDVVDRSDMFWPEIGLVGESDGDLKYDGRYGDARAVLRSQSERDRRLRAQPRVRSLVHWGWADATRVDSLRSILIGVGLRQREPEHPAHLSSLRRALAPHPPHRTA